MATNVLGNFVCVFWYHRLLMPNFSRFDLPVSPTGFIFLLPSFLLLCIRENVRIDINEKIKVRLALFVLVTYSPCHVVTLQSVIRAMPCRYGIRCYLFKT